jgi:hypothetical protein
MVRVGSSLSKSRHVHLRSILGAAKYDTVHDLDQREAREEELDLDQLGTRLVTRTEENK